jgi:hypothetical protein
VLAGHPKGCASLADLTRYVSVLVSCGSDWTNRMKCLAARAPDLDIFSQAFVLRDNAGWQITDAGRAFLASAEIAIQNTVDNEQAPEVVAMSVQQLLTSPPTRSWRKPAQSAPSGRRPGASSRGCIDVLRCAPRSI